MGNLLTKLEVERIGLKSHGSSTLGGRKVWFDHDVKRLNYDDHGQYLGEFHSEDAILVILDTGEFYTTNFDLNNHYEQNILRIEKFDPEKVWTAALYDAEQGYPYLKRFTLEATTRHQNFIGERVVGPTTVAQAAAANSSTLLLLTDTVYPRLLLRYGAPDDFREPLEIDAEQFIGQKSFKAKGKRITTLTLASIEELEPTRLPEPEDTPEEPDSTESPDSPADPDGADSGFPAVTPPSDAAAPESPDSPASPEDADSGSPAVAPSSDAAAPESSPSVDPATGQLSLFD